MAHHTLALNLALSLIVACIALPVHAEIEEVVVTARKTEESISESPVAVSALNQSFFEEGAINTIEEVARFVPGLELTPLNTSRATGPKMRGISTFSFSDGFESSVATVLDGVVMGREAQGFFDLYGIESVEVLKGPQGTLFGKNASAGVINVRTLAPEFETGGGFDISYGSYNEILARGTITGPITEDTLAYRLSGSVNQHDGKIDNVLPADLSRHRPTQPRHPVRTELAGAAADRCAGGTRYRRWRGQPRGCRARLAHPAGVRGLRHFAADRRGHPVG